ncbi:MAG: class I SAM-dependent methyltransferase [Jatrophihabitans sp.]
MNRHDFLSGVHAAYKPRNYLEIGINDGRGLHRSHTRTIGVDPAFKITAEFECDLKMVKATSDDFFARNSPIARFAEGVIDMAFIDGMHIFEYALRDFMNTEKLAAPSSVIVFDDMLPRTVGEAARDRHTMDWTGDVFRVISVLEKYRPDLAVIPLDTEPTGLLLVLGADPTNTVLQDNYDAILKEFIHPDPQDVPENFLHRTDAADPFAVLATSVWADLITARESGVRPDSVDRLTELRGGATYVSNPGDPGVWPPKRAAAPKPAPRATQPVPTLTRRVRQAIKRRL